MAILKSKRSAFEQRLLTLRQQTPDAKLVHVQESESGDHVVVTGVFEGLEAEYGSSDPKRMLSAMADMVALTVLSNTGWPPHNLRILIDAERLLRDMEARNNNPLIKYASKAGRRGKRKASHYVVEARRAMLAAAKGHHHLQSSVPTARHSFRHSCDWVASRMNRTLKEFQLSLDGKMPGRWSTLTAERAEQEKSAATWGERIEGWQEEFKDDADLQYRMKMLEEREDPSQIEHFIETQIANALHRLVVNGD